MVETSASLLERCRGADSRAWKQLVDLYTPFIRSWIHRFGFQSDDADDLVQEIFLKLCKEIPDFHYDRKLGQFRGWLREFTRNRVREFCRKKTPIAVGADSDMQNQLDQLADRHSGISKLWDQEHDRFVLHRFLEMIKPDFEPKSWEAFKRVALDGRNPSEVAKELEMERGAVYVVKSRILARLRQEMAGILDDETGVGQ